MLGWGVKGLKKIFRIVNWVPISAYRWFHCNSTNWEEVGDVCCTTCPLVQCVYSKGLVFVTVISLVWFTVATSVDGCRFVSLGFVCGYELLMWSYTCYFAILAILVQGTCLLSRYKVFGYRVLACYVGTRYSDN